MPQIKCDYLHVRIEFGDPALCNLPLVADEDLSWTETCSMWKKCRVKVNRFIRMESGPAQLLQECGDMGFLWGRTCMTHQHRYLDKMMCKNVNAYIHLICSFTPSTSTSLIMRFIFEIFKLFTIFVKTLLCQAYAHCESGHRTSPYWPFKCNARS